MGDRCLQAQHTGLQRGHRHDGDVDRAHGCGCGVDAVEGCFHVEQSSRTCVRKLPYRLLQFSKTEPTTGVCTMAKDWVQWHRGYDDPLHPLARRLEIVVGLIRRQLDTAPAGPIRVLSLCAGDGRDL